MSIQGFFIHRVSVERGVSSAGGTYGGSGTTWTTIESSLRCRVVPSRGDEELMNQQLGYSFSHRVYCGANTNVQVQDRIMFGSLELRVQAVKNPDHMNRFLRIDVEEVSDGRP